MLELVVALAAGILILCLLAKLISLPFKLVWKLVTNSLAGAILLWVADLFGAGIEITFIKALIAGVFGIPGVIVILLLQ